MSHLDNNLMDVNSLLTTDFKDTLKAFIDLDDQIELATKSISALKKKRDEMKDKMYKRMRTHNVDEIDLKSGKIQTVVTKRSAPLNKDWIYQRCLLLFKGDEQQAEYATEFIADPKHRPKKETHTLKRKKPRKKKNKN